VAAAILVFWLFVWLSPQLYYSYYCWIIPGLPWQPVIKVPPGPERLGALLSFQARSSLADHSAGLLGWCLILCGIFKFNHWLKSAHR